MKHGLVLEGGAMRGLFTAGVMDVLLEEGIFFDVAVGVSAGAAFGCNYKSRQAGRVLRYNTRYCRDKRYSSLYSLITTGDLYGADFCYRLLPETLDPFDWETYEKNPMEFFAVCTNVNTGKAEYFLCQGERKRQMEIFRAGASMPLVSRMVEIDGSLYLDGGVASSIPLSFLQEKGIEKNTVILTQPRAYRKQANGAMPLVKAVYRKYPALCDAMERRHLAYNEEKDRVFDAEQRGEVFVFCPENPLPVKRTEKDPKKLLLTYQLGQQCARDRLEAYRRFREA